MTMEHGSKIPCPLRTAALATPEASAILTPEKAISYAELDEMVTSTAQILEQNYDPGTRVGIYLPRDERYIVLLLALLRAECVFVPLSTRIPAEGVYPLLRKVGCSALITEDKEILERLPKGVAGLAPEALFGGQQNTPSELHKDPGLSLGSFASIIFTSGSTGGPKAALHTFGNHYYSALGSNANIELRPGDRWLLSLPLYHVGGLSIIFRCLISGAGISLPDPKWLLGRSIERMGITHVSLVATQLRRLLKDETNTATLKAVLLGGGPTPENLVEEVLTRSIPLHTSYGLTEMASQVTCTPPEASLEDLSTSGRSLAHRELGISEKGEILVRGKTLFAGYIEGEKVDRPLNEDGWFHTGDLGELDGVGNLRVLGRSDNLFISGGENIQPEEVEAALELIEGVEKAVVSPVPDSEFGERPVAFVKTAQGETSREDLAEELRETLPGFMVPVAYHPWPGEADPERMKPDRRLFQELAARLHPGDSA